MISFPSLPPNIMRLCKIATLVTAIGFTHIATKTAGHSENEYLVSDTQKKIDVYTQAIKKNPENWLAHYHLGNIYAQQRNYTDAIDHLDRVKNKQPFAAPALYDLAYCQRHNHGLQEALTTYTAALELTPNNCDAHLGRASTLLALGKFLEAWPEFEYRLDNWKEFHQYLKYQTLNLTTLADKKIILLAEWGQGDMLQFIRYAQELKKLGATVYVQTFRSLVKLFSLCPYVDSVVAQGSPLPKADIRIPMLSLPLVFQTTVETIPAETPYLYADPILEKEWHKKLSVHTNFKIGICWRGTLQKAVPLSTWTPLIAAMQHATFFSLVKNGTNDIQATALTDSIIDFGEHFDECHGSFMDTAAIMKNLDLVITTDTSLAHLAGGLGIPIWVLLPYDCDWRWFFEGTTSPWYPTMRLFRQPKLNDWVSVIQEVTELLQTVTATKVYA